MFWFICLRTLGSLSTVGTLKVANVANPDLLELRIAWRAAVALEFLRHPYMVGDAVLPAIVAASRSGITVQERTYSTAAEQQRQQ